VKNQRSKSLRSKSAIVQKSVWADYEKVEGKAGIYEQLRQRKEKFCSGHLDINTEQLLNEV
jgi:hypothetical protein